MGDGGGLHCHIMIMDHGTVVMGSMLLIGAMVVLSSVIMIHLGMLHLGTTVVLHVALAVICKRGC
jgi:hypothetical protein